MARRAAILVLIACALAATWMPTAFAQVPGNSTFDIGRGEIGRWLPTDSAQGFGIKVSAEFEVGGLSLHGNTNSDSALVRTRIQTDDPEWRNSFRAESYYLDTDPGPTTEQHRVALKTAYKFTTNNYVFGAMRYDRAEAQGIVYRFTEVAGYGRRIFQDKQSFLVLEAGGGARQTRPINDTALVKEPVAVTQAEFNWEWSYGSVFNTYLVIEYGEVNTVSIWQTSLTWRIASNIGARMNYDVTANSKVPEGLQKIDRIFSFSFLYQI